MPEIRSKATQYCWLNVYLHRSARSELADLFTWLVSDKRLQYPYAFCRVLIVSSEVFSYQQQQQQQPRLNPEHLVVCGQRTPRYAVHDHLTNILPHVDGQQRAAVTSSPRVTSVVDQTHARRLSPHCRCEPDDLYRNILLQASEYADRVPVKGAL